MNYSLIIPNYNGSEFLPNCIQSLINAIKLCPNIKLEIILVDNGSSDDSLKVATTIYPEIKIIKNKQNFGFAKAVNQGIALAKYEYVVLVNNDIVLDKNWFKNIDQTINNNPDKKNVVFSGTVLDKNGENYESVGLKYFSFGKCKNIKNKQKYIKDLHQKLNITNIWGASAALTVYKKDVLIKIGFFDEDFFAYEEDVDLSLRLNKLNYKTLFIPKAISYHLGGATSSKMGNFRHSMDAKNWIYIIIKNYSTKDLLNNFFPIIVERLRNFSGLIKNTSILDLPTSIIKTYGEVIVNIAPMLKKRHQIQTMLKSN